MVKLQREGLDNNFQNTAVVLTSQTKKMPVIHADFSGLLRTYHRYFLDSLQRSSKLIFLGYSGNDMYLNNEISYVMQSNRDLQIEVVIWYPDSNENKEEIWHSKLQSKNRKFKKRIKFIPLEDIRDYF